MPGEPSFPRRLAEICFEAAELILSPSAGPSGADAEPTAQWEYERHMWSDERGTEEPMDWVAEATSTYLVEAAHQVRAIGLLLLGGVVAAALDPLVRAVVERAGRVKWILDPTIDHAKRGARAGLEFGVSLSAYRRTLDRLGAPPTTRREMQNRVRAHRSQLEAMFTVVRPPSDPCDPDSPPSTEMTEWVVAGEAYPNYGSNAGYALECQWPSRSPRWWPTKVPTQGSSLETAL